MANLYTAEVTIKANDQASSKIEEVAQEAKSAASELENAGREAESAGKKTKESANGGWSVLGNVASNLITNGIQKATQAVVNFARATVTSGMNFESSMSKVKALSGATSEEFESLKAAAEEAGATTVFSASDAADALGYMALAGWDASESTSALNGVLDLASAGAMDLASASDLVTDYMSAFGWEANRASEFADRLAYAQANSNTNVTQLGEAYQNCAANMNAAGQSMETTTALIEAMSNQGTKGARAGTVLAAMMRDLTANMEDGSIAIGDTNIAVQDASGNYRNLTDILKDVDSATQGMGDAEEAAALSAVFTADSIKGINLVLNEGVDNVADYEAALYDCDGTASDMAGTMNDNLAGSIKTLDSVTEHLQLTLYEKFEPAMQFCVDTATDLISRIDDFVQSISKIPDAISAWASGSKEAMDEVTQSTLASTSEMKWATQYLSTEQAAAVNNWIDNSQKQADATSEMSDSVTDDLSDVGYASSDTSDGMSDDASDVASAYAEMESNISDTADNLVYDITGMWDKISDDTDASIDELIADMQKQTESMRNWASNMQTLAAKGLDEGLIAKLQEAGPESAQLVQEMVDADDDELEKLVTAFRDNTDAATEAAKVEMASGCAGIVSTASSYRSDMEDAGSYMMEGLASGIKYSSETVNAAAKNVMRQAVKAGKAEARIASPSKVWRDEVGYMLGAGMAVGLDNSIPTVEKAVEKAMQSAQNAANSDISVGIRYAGAGTEYATESAPGAISDMSAGISEKLVQLISILTEYLPMLSVRQIVLDSGKTVGELAPLLNTALGQIDTRRARTT